MLLVIRVSHLGEKSRWDNFRSHKFGGSNQIIICGKRDLEDNYFLDGDVLYLRCRDKWEDLPEKMIAAYNAILDIEEFNDYTTFLKVDADIVPKPSFNPNHITKLTSKNNYIGANLRRPAIHQHGIYHLKKNLSNESPWKGKKYSNKEMLSCTFALGGLGYVLSRKSLEIITSKYTFNNLHKVKHEFIYEDAMVGIILRRVKINPIKSPLHLRDTRTNVKSTIARRKRPGNRRRRQARPGRNT